MRDLKPLSLPKLVAARKSSKSSLSLDMAMAHQPSSSSMYSCTDSGFYSECSTPPTPGQSQARGHLRYPSSTSSLSSSPPNHDSFDLPNASGKLPNLPEEPVEREDYVMVNENERYSCTYHHIVLLSSRDM